MKAIGWACVMWAAIAMTSWAEADEQEPKHVPRVLISTIIDVEFAIQKVNPPNLVVTAIGQVPTGGYTDALLTRAVYPTPPADGIQDYFFSAVKPDGPAIQVISTIQAQDTWKDYQREAPWLEGVRIHGVNGGVKEVRLTK